MTHHRPVDAMVYPRFEGIRTFMRLPHLADPARLTETDLAVVGVPFDSGATYRVGARFGPAGIRHESMLLRPYHPELAVDVHASLSLADGGDLPVTPGYLRESHDQIREGARQVLASGTVPLFLGGDHSVSLPLLRAVAERWGPVALLHVDAHCDLWPGYFGDKETHGTPFRRAVEEGLIDPRRSVQVGLRGPVYGPEDVTLPARLGLEAISADTVHRQGVATVSERIRARLGGVGPRYLSLDIDALDPSQAPGTGTPEIGGLSAVQVQQLLRGLAGLDFVGFDVVEVLPAYDVGGLTQLLAANLAFELIALTAVAKLGAGERRPDPSTARHDLPDTRGDA
jgi:agmatinase